MSAQPADLLLRPPADAPEVFSLLQLALEQWPGEVTLLSLELTIRWINPAAAARLGRSAADCIGRRWLTLHTESGATLQDIERALQGEVMDIAARAVRTAAGSLRYASVRIQPVMNGNVCAGLMLVERDVTAELWNRDLDMRRAAIVRTIARGSRDLICLLDADGRVLFVSDGVRDVLGLDVESAIGSNVFERIHPDDLREVRERIANGDVLHTPQQLREMRFRFCHLDGSWRWLIGMAVNALADPNLAAIIVVARDATEELAAAERSRSRERRLSHLTENTQDLILVFAADGRCTFESTSVQRQLGFAPGELSQDHLLQCVHPAFRKHAVVFVKQIVAERARSVHLEFMFAAKTGGYRWLEASGTNFLHDPDIQGVVINARDITARKQSALQLEAALQGSEVGLWEQDLSTRHIHFLNHWRPAGAHEFLTHDHSEADWAAAIHPLDFPAVQLAYDNLESGQAALLHIEYRFRAPGDGWIWLLERAQLTGISPRTGGQMVSGAIIDISARRRTETALEVARERLSFAIERAQVGFYEWQVDSGDLLGLDDWCRALSIDYREERGLVQWHALVHPDDLSRLQQIFSEHVQGRSEIGECEYRIRSKAGGWLWIVDRGQIVERTSEGRALRVAGVVMDITRLRRTESRLDAAQWAAQFGLWELDVASGSACWFSDWCARQDLEPCTGDHVASWDSRIHVDDLAAAEARFTAHLAGQDDFYEAEYRIRCNTGEWRWIEERGRVVERDSRGVALRMVGICINVDARKRADEALRRSEFLYRTVAEFSEGYVAEFDLQRGGLPQLAWVSDGFEKTYGCTVGEFLARGGWKAAYHPSDYDSVLQRVAQLVRGEQAEGVARIVRASDGAIRWLHIITRPIFHPKTGAVTGGIGVAHDITERKNSENELIESRALMQSVTENTPDWLMQIDAQAVIRFVNRPIMGVPPAQLIGRNIYELNAPTDDGRMRRFLDAVLAGVENVEVEIQSPDPTAVAFNGLRHALFRARAVRVRGKISGVVIHATDVSAQRHQERLLQLQAKILETTQEGVVLIDPNNRITLTNPAFELMFGYPSGTLAGKSVEPLFRLDEHAARRTAAKIRAQIGAANPQPFEFVCARRDGSLFTATCVVMSMSIHGADHWLAMLHDVTDRKLLEREIIEVSNRDQQRFGNDLHDGLGQELTGVAMLLRALQGRLRHATPEANQEFDNVVQLVNRTIQSTRALAHGLSPVSLDRGGIVGALRTLASGARDTSKVKVSLRTSLSAPIQLDEVAATHLYRIAQEALNNAMRHGRATSVTMVLHSDESMVRLAVHDNGTGMRHTLANTKGLGLRTMQYRAQALGGDLVIEPSRNGGTTVRCVCAQDVRIPDVRRPTRGRRR